MRKMFFEIFHIKQSEVPKWLSKEKLFFGWCLPADLILLEKIGKNHIIVMGGAHSERIIFR